jgi:lipoate-protein ligase A
MDKVILRYSYLKSNDPFTNLATENEILINIPRNTIHLLFWINSPSVVMGRFQNPFLECKLADLAVDNVQLVRRQSGGGCVYHDKGNLNYSFVCSKELHNKDNNHAIIVEALKNLDIMAYSTKRVDLFFDDKDGPKKFSGSAFKEKKDSALHHGTLLLNSDLDKLNYYLNPKESKIKSVSIPSVRSVVINLSEINPKINPKIVIDKIVSSFESFYKSSCKKMDSHQFDLAYLSELKSKKWVLGETPKFSLNDGFVVNKIQTNIFIEIKKLHITSFNAENSEVHPSLLKELESILVGVDILDEAELFKVIKAFGLNFPMYGEFIEHLESWFKTQFSGLHMLSNRQLN